MTMTTYRILVPAVLICAMVCTMSAQAADRQTLHGHVPAAVGSLRSIGRLPGTTNLNMAIGLPLRNQDALTNLLQQIYDPASPNYRHYLTCEQFTEQFGPTEEDYQALIAFAKAHGLTVNGRHQNRMILDVQGAAAVVEKVFHVTIHTYRHPTEDRTFYAPDREPSLDLAVPVLHVSGLDNYWKPHPRVKARSLAGVERTTPNVGSGPGGNYMGTDFRTAYVPGSALTGAGQTVGLLQFDGYTSNDITYYEATNGLPNVNLTNVLLDGFDGTPTGNGGEVEVSLDIEMVISMAPGISNVIVYQAGPNGVWYDILNRMATDNLAKQLSCSWYIPGGAADLVADGIFQQMAAQGQSFLNASGDDDAYTALIDFPGDTPYITQVGGTTLTMIGTGGVYSSETVWNWGGGTGSGGGVSTYYPIPDWQQGIDMTMNHGSTTMRNTPDVALTADHVYVRADGTDYDDVGGTSCAAPLWAGFTALMNQQNGEMPLGFLNPAIYALGMRANYTNCFHDIMTGNNYSTGSPTNFPAVVGYDLCTGLGTPTGSALINALTEPLQITPATPFIFTGPVGGPFGPAAQNYSLNNTGTNALSWALADSASWLSASPMSGTIPMGGPAATVTVSLTSAATSFSAGSYSTSMAFTNSDDNVGQTRQVILAVVTMPIITMQPTNRAVLEGMPAAFAVGTGSNALMFYQWQYDGSNLTDNGNMSGSVTTNLTIANVSPANVGTYSVIVSNAAGTAFSSNALLTIMPSLPIFTEQPTNQTSLPGQTVTFTVATVGTHPFSYRWRDNGTNLSDNAIISGSSNVTLTLNNVSPANAGIYSVVVSNALGAVTSSNAVLEVDSVTATGVTLNCAYSFGVSDGEYPYCPLVQGADGSLYGTTVEGGTNGGYGTVFRMATNGALTTLYSFGSADGASPYAGLLLGKDGNFYGTTAGGGTNDDGTIFQITTNGVLTTLMSFNDTNGSFSVAGLMQASDGNLYGTTLDGGIHEMGTVFRVTTNGALTTMFSFDSLHGSHSSAVLTQGVDGNFYGTTETGGSDNFGTVFRLTTNGTLTTLVSFDYTNNGAYPIPGLVQDTDGSFYGTTYYGGANYEGTIFKMTPDGTLTTLNSFAGSDGAYPYGGLMLGSDGNLYGTTEEGGSYWYGTVFRLTPDGTLLKLLDFDGYQGLSPEAALIQTADGDLYGTTAWGGVGYSGSNPGYGAIFQINIDCPLQFTRQPASQSVFVGADAILSAAVSGSAPLYYQWRGNGTNLTDGGNIYGSANRTLTFSNVIPGNAGTYSLIVSNTQGFVVSSNATLAVTSSAPIIVLQPANQTSLPDGIVEFAVQALGNVPMSYQWWFNSTNMTGATNATLIMTGITTNQAGNYSVVVSNTAGFATSSNATLSVITNAPTSLMTFDDLKGTGLPVPDGYNGLNWNNFYYLDGVNFSGNPSGYGAGVVSQSNVAYNAYGNPATISSAASFSLLSAYLTAAWSSNLHVEVIGYAGDTLKYDNTYTVSTNAPTFINFNYSTITMVEFISANNSQIVIDNMTIMTAPAVPQIITQPVDLMVRAGATAVFSVAALGTEPFSYFWQRNGTSIPGTTGASVAIHNVQPSDSGSAFSCIVSNAYGAATSQVAVLTLATNRDYFTELFDPGSNHVNDLSYKMLTFTPDGSTSFYKANCDPTDAFQSSSNGVALTLSDDNYVQINLLSGAQVSLYGTNYSTLFIGSNGYITFGSGDWRYDESLMNHFNRPRISALFVDLDPSFGGAVTWTQLVDRVVVTFQDVFDWDSGGQNSFQYELFYNGVIRLSYLGISAEEGLAGLSQGAGVPADFADSDLTSYGPSDALVVQPAGGLNVQGCQGGPFAPTNIVYTLYNNEGSAVGWTASDIQSWVTLSASGGTLAAGASTNVMVSINTNAWNLGVGTSQATVTFSNNVSGAFQAREVVLTIVDYNWWPTGFEAWTNRMMLTFSGYSRPETLTNFPALAILNANLPGFSYGQFASTNGYDLRFSTADGSDNLKYEIEQWNTNGTSLVWIQVPQLYSGYYIWAYWGNTNAGVASAPPAYATNGAAWDAKAFAAVWHMGQSNALDSTANKNKGTAIAAVSNAVGMIGGAQKMSGNAHVTIPNSGSLDFTAPNATYSAWVCFSTVPNGEQVLIRNEQYRELGFSDATHLRDMLNTTGMSGWTAGNDDLISPAPVVGHWYYVAFTYNGSVIRNFWNGVPLNAGHTVTGNINFDTYTTGIGAYNGNGDAGPISLAINAIIDEVRIEQVFRSTNWIWATYMTVASNASFSAYGVAQTAVATNEIPPAAWIQEYFPGTATSNYAGLAASDADGNGMTVWQDYLAGINPTNHSSSFSVIIATSGGQIIVSVPSILTDSNYNGLTRYYDIEQCTNLLISGSWQLVPNYSGLPANGGIVACTNATQDHATFYRARAKLQ